MPVFTASDGARLFYRDDGRGKPVLALSGLTRNGSDFDYIAPHLRSVRLIRPDYRGRGLSEWSGAGTYTIPTEAGDVLSLLDHLGIENAAILGTSRGGLIAMTLALMAKSRLSGVCLVDVGPVIAPAGLDAIKSYIGRNPVQKSYAEAAGMRAKLMAGFEDVPASRWETEVRKHYVETPDGLKINYDPSLREAVLTAVSEPTPDLWPLFDAMVGLPLALIRGANSDLLASGTANEMKRRRPDMLFAEIPGRGHVPFLDEDLAVKTIESWIGSLQ